MQIGSLTCVQEMYFGKPKACIKAEYYIGLIRQKLIGSASNNGVAKSIVSYTGSRDVVSKNKESIMRTKEWKSLKRLLENQFGFYSISLILVESPKSNAMTVPISGSIDNVIQSKPYNSLTITKQGYKYDKKAKFCIMLLITEGLLVNTKLSDSEVLAIILHEIGHTFDSATFKYMGPLSLIKTIYDSYSNFSAISPQFAMVGAGINVVKRSQKANNKTSEFINKQIDMHRGKILSGILGVLFMLMNSGRNSIKVVLEFLSPILGNSASTVYSIILYIQRLIKNISDFSITKIIGKNAYSIIFGHTREHFADKFASMHGYGPELVSALGKIEISKFSGSTLETYIEKVPLIKDIYGLGVVSLVDFFDIFIKADPHPNFSARFNSIKNIIKADLDRPGIDEASKKLLLSQIKEIDDKYKEYESKSKNISSATKTQSYIHSFLNKLFPGRGDIFSFALDKAGIMSDKKINKRVDDIKSKSGKRFKLI